MKLPDSPSAGLPAPFRWTPADGEAPVVARGTLPTWLRGTLTRTAPAVFSWNGWEAEHWFDGLAVLYAFSFEGAVVRFRQRLLGSRAARLASEGQRLVSTFSTPMKRPWWKRALQPIPDVTDNANVNVVPWRGQWVAMTETPLQHLIDAVTLHTRGTTEPRFGLRTLTAHPAYDASSRQLINLGCTFGRRSEVMVFREGADGVQHLEGRLPVDRAPYVHSFGQSERFVTLIEHPLSCNPLTFLWSERPLISHFTWQPERATRFRVLNRRDGTWKTFETEPFFVFHVVNQYERGDAVVIELLRYPDAKVIQALDLASLRGQLPDLDTAFVRYVLEPGSARAKEERIGSTTFEFPNVAIRGAPHRFTWGVAITRHDGHWRSSVVKVDGHTGASIRFADPRAICGEPVFVPKPGAQAEDEGVLLTMSSAPEGRSWLTVLDAASLESIAELEVPGAIPLGFHGTFQSDVKARS